MKQVIIEYGDAGLNSKRLILNAVIDLVECTEDGGIVRINPEVSLHDVQDWLREGLVYQINSGIMTRKNLKTGESKQFIDALVE